jgi:hypothetical protein
MRRSSILAAVAAVSLSGFMFTSTAESASCGQSGRDNAHSKCVRATGGSIAVVTTPGGNKVVCYMLNKRSFWAPRAAGTKDGTRWYSVVIPSGTRYFSELRYINGRAHKTIGGC